MNNIFVNFNRSDLGLRWSSHKRHRELLEEFYFHNKYYLTEQMKDTILDAIDCLNAIEKLTEMSKEEKNGSNSVKTPE